MKAILIILACVTSALADTTLTIVIPTADQARVTEAFGSILGKTGSATAADIEAAITVWLNGQTQDYEKRKNMAAFTPPPLQAMGSAGTQKKAAPTATPKKKK